MAKQILPPSVRREKIIHLKKPETNHQTIPTSGKERMKNINQWRGAQTSSEMTVKAKAFQMHVLVKCQQSQSIKNTAEIPSMKNNK